VGVLWISACNGGNVKPGHADYPEPNPAPKSFLFLHGTIDAPLDIDFRIQWHAEAPQCQYATSRIEGAYSWYTAWSPLTVARQGTSFSARVPIDGMLPGRCQWRFGGVTFGGKAGYRTALIATNSPPLNPGQSADGVIELRCSWDHAQGHEGDDRSLSCRSPKPEDRNASVLGGVLWWHPEARDLEVHFVAD
jgi:hypothetical protein